MKNKNDILELIENLKRTDVKELVEQRIKEFKKYAESNESGKLFSELCFCILTANCSAEKCIEIQRKIGNNFLNLNEKQLTKKLREFGYRFPNIRASYITEARKHNLDKLMNIKNEQELRLWLVDNVKGLGMKEASHFLRNIGYSDTAIIDFHIIDVLKRYKIIDKLKALTTRKYLEIEEKLREIANKTNLSLAELDLYLWYAETGKVLK